MEILSIIEKHFSQKNYKNNHCFEENKHKKYMEILKSVFKEYYIIDFNDYDDFKCYEYIVLLHKNQDILDDDVELLKVIGGTRYDLHIYISEVGNYSYYFILETIFEENDYKFKKINAKEISLFETLKKELKKEGLIVLTENEVRQIVPNIQTEFCEPGKANVFKCLFTDLSDVD